MRRDSPFAGAPASPGRSLGREQPRAYIADVQGREAATFTGLNAALARMRLRIKDLR